jgi:hypothetical protein
MRLYNQTHAFYAGVDLHARTMFTHILEQRGRTVFEPYAFWSDLVFLKRGR